MHDLKTAHVAKSIDLFQINVKLQWKDPQKLQTKKS